MLWWYKCSLLWRSSMMMETVNVLFLGGAKRVSLAQHLIRAGEERNLKVNVYSYELDDKVPISSIAKVIIGKKWSDADLFDDLKRVTEVNDISIILPFVDPAIAVAARLKEFIPALFVPVSPMELCNVMFNKFSAACWFEKHQIKQPRFYRHKDDYKYPVILKPVCGSASKGIKICYEAEALPSDDRLSDYLVQDYIKDRKEYTVDCYVDKNGNVISVVPRLRLETAGGEVTKSVTVRHHQIISESKRILQAGSFRGPITIQFIEECDTHEVFVMEINPRLGGGVITSIEANSLLLESLWDEYKGIPVSAVDDWEEGLLLTRYFKEVVFHADSH